jgi:spermidine synthase
MRRTDFPRRFRIEANRTLLFYRTHSNRWERNRFPHSSLKKLVVYSDPPHSGGSQPIRQAKGMKPQVKLATTQTPDGGELSLYQHDRDFTIMINGLQLMNSRQHESEMELARLGCSRLAGGKSARVLIGGLGMGYTLRQTLDLLGPDAHVVVSELLPAVVEWNRTHLHELNGQALEDGRVELVSGDIFQLLAETHDQFDAILLDVDNGPRAITDSGNQRLYGHSGMIACRRALRKQGLLAVWSAVSSKPFEQLLMNCGFQVRRYRVKAYAGGSSKPLFIWVAAQDATLLPPGGGEPRPPEKPEPGTFRKFPRRKA